MDFSRQNPSLVNITSNNRITGRAEQQSTNNNLQNLQAIQQSIQQTVSTDSSRPPQATTTSRSLIKTNTKSYSCTRCWEVFSDRGALTMHSRTHNNEEDKPYRCEHCEKRFFTHYLLKQHQQAHSESKRFQCPQCECSYKRLDHLQQHFRRHTGVRAYKCDWPGCGEMFFQQGHLKYHKNCHKRNPTKTGKLYRARHYNKSKKDNKDLKLSSDEKSLNQNSPSTSNYLNKLAVTSKVSTTKTKQLNPVSESQEKIRPVPCPFCGKLFVPKPNDSSHQHKCTKQHQQLPSASTTRLQINNSNLQRSEMNRNVRNRTDSAQSTQSMEKYEVSEKSNKLMDKLFDKVKIYEQYTYNYTSYSIPSPTRHQAAFSKLSNHQVSSLNSSSLQRPQLNPLQTNHQSLQRTELNRMITNRAEACNKNPNVVQFQRGGNSNQQINNLIHNSNTKQNHSYLGAANQVALRHQAPFSKVSNHQVSSLNSFSMQRPQFNPLQTNHQSLQRSEMNRMVTNRAETYNKNPNVVQFQRGGNSNQRLDNFIDNSNTKQNHSYLGAANQIATRHQAPISKVSTHQVSSLNSFSMQRPQFNPLQTNHQSLQRPEINRMVTNRAETCNKNPNVVQFQRGGNSNQRLDNFIDNSNTKQNHSYLGAANQVATRHQAPISKVSNHQVSSLNSFSMQRPQFNPLQTNHQSLQRPEINRMITNSAEACNVNPKVVQFQRGGNPNQRLNNLIDNSNTKQNHSYLGAANQIATRHQAPFSKVSTHQVPSLSSFSMQRPQLNPIQTNHQSLQRPEINRMITNSAETCNKNPNVVQFQRGGNSNEQLDNLIDNSNTKQNHSYLGAANQIATRHQAPISKVSTHQVPSLSSFSMQRPQLNPIQTNHQSLQPSERNRMVTNRAETGNVNPKVVQFQRGGNPNQRLDNLIHNSNTKQNHSYLGATNQIATRHQVTFSEVSINQVTSLSSSSLQRPPGNLLQTNHQSLQRPEFNRMITKSADTNNINSNVGTCDVRESFDEVMAELFDNSDTFERNTYLRVTNQVTTRHQAPFTKVSTNQVSSLSSCSIQRPQLNPIQTNHQSLQRPERNRMVTNRAETCNVNPKVVQFQRGGNPNQRLDNLIDNSNTKQNHSYLGAANQIATRHQAPFSKVSTHQVSSLISCSIQRPQFNSLQTNHQTLQRSEMNRMITNRAETCNVNPNVVQFQRGGNPNQRLDNLIDNSNTKQNHSYLGAANQIATRHQAPFSKVSTHQVSSLSSCSIQRPQLNPIQTNHQSLQRSEMNRTITNRAETCNKNPNVVQFQRGDNSNQRLDNLIDNSNTKQNHSYLGAANQVATRHQVTFSEVSINQVTSLNSTSLQRPQLNPIQTNHHSLQRPEINRMITNRAETCNKNSNVVQFQRGGNPTQRLDNLIDNSNTKQNHSYLGAANQIATRHQAPFSKVSTHQVPSLSSFSMQRPQFNPIQTNHQSLQRPEINRMITNSAETCNKNPNVVQFQRGGNSNEQLDNLIDNSNTKQNHSYLGAANQIATRHQAPFSKVSTNQVSSLSSCSIQRPQFNSLQTNHQSLQRSERNKMMTNRAENCNVNPKVVQFQRGGNSNQRIDNLIDNSNTKENHSYLGAANQVATRHQVTFSEVSINQVTSLNSTSLQRPQFKAKDIQNNSFSNPNMSNECIDINMEQQIVNSYFVNNEHQQMDIFLQGTNQEPPTHERHITNTASNPVRSVDFPLSSRVESMDMFINTGLGTSVVNTEIAPPTDTSSNQVISIDHSSSDTDQFNNSASADLFLPQSTMSETEEDFELSTTDQISIDQLFNDPLHEYDIFKF